MRRSVLFVISLMLLINVMYGQKEWKEAKTDGGRISVKSRVYKIQDEKSNEIQMVEYIASTQAEVNFEKCIALLKNVSIHTQFLDYTEVSEKIKDLSDDEWLIYYYFDAPWPMANSDCVVQIKYRVNAERSYATFEGEAKPDLYEMKDVGRSVINDIKYEFTKLEEGKVEIKITSKFSPTTIAPNWLASTYFPGGPTKMLNKMIKLVSD